MLERRQRVELPIERAFEFYGEARNLEEITPPWLGFEVTTPGTIEMAEGRLIEYRLRLHGLPIRWRTRIAIWEPPHRFVDVQVSGPYALWEHTHSFEAAGPGATIIGDLVRYALPYRRHRPPPPALSSQFLSLSDKKNTVGGCQASSMEIEKAAE